MKNIYIVCDAPPSRGVSTFIEVEDAKGCSLSTEQTGAMWLQLQSGYWALGPFESQQGGVDSERQLLEKVAEEAERLTHAIGPESYHLAYDALKEAIDALDQLRGETVTLKIFGGDGTLGEHRW